MQVLLTMEEYESLHKEVKDLQRIIAVLVHRDGGEATIHRLQTYNLNHTITPIRNKDPRQKYPDGWRIIVEEIKHGQGTR